MALNVRAHCSVHKHAAEQLVQRRWAPPPSADPSCSGRRALGETTWCPLWEPGARLKGYASD